MATLFGPDALRLFYIRTTPEGYEMTPSYKMMKLVRNFGRCFCLPPPPVRSSRQACQAPLLMLGDGKGSVMLQTTADSSKIRVMSSFFFSSSCFIELLEALTMNSGAWHDCLPNGGGGGGSGPSHLDLWAEVRSSQGNFHPISST